VIYELWGGYPGDLWFMGPVIYDLWGGYPGDLWLLWFMIVI
jgi:hypothetical protein